MQVKKVKIEGCPICLLCVNVTRVASMASVWLLYYRFAVADSKTDATNVHFKSAFQCVNRSKAVQLQTPPPTSLNLFTHKNYSEWKVTKNYVSV